MADAAHADPISLAVTAIAQAIGSITSIGVIGKLILTVALNVGLSLIEKAMAKKDQPQPAGAKLEISMGDDHAVSFVIGNYATAGRRKYAGSWGEDGKTPNTYFTDVIEVGNLPNYAGERGLTADRLQHLPRWHRDLQPDLLPRRRADRCLHDGWQQRQHHAGDIYGRVGRGFWPL